MDNSDNRDQQRNAKDQGAQMFWWKITGGKRGEVCMGDTLHWMMKGAASHSNGIRVILEFQIPALPLPRGFEQVPFLYASVCSSAQWG